MSRRIAVSKSYRSSNSVTLYCGDCLEFLRKLPTNCAQLVLTSPPYNIGKLYEQRTPLDEYLSFIRLVIDESVRVLSPGGSICWQVGTHVDKNGAVLPLDIALHPIFSSHKALVLRNRIVWTFGHGRHCTKRFSGRHETILWYTKGDKYIFNLDAVRVPQKYPKKKSYQERNRGELSCNPLGKNPGDVWDIPNVKGNHTEKTEHPCQFPIALAENLILATTNRRHLVVDPFLGSGTTAIAALKHKRRAAGADMLSEYLAITRERIKLLEAGTLPYRDRLKPVFIPPGNENSINGKAA